MMKSTLQLNEEIKIISSIPVEVLMIQFQEQFVAVTVTSDRCCSRVMQVTDSITD